jgi:hypothetical protein
VSLFPSLGDVGSCHSCVARHHPYVGGNADKESQDKQKLEAVRAQRVELAKRRVLELGPEAVQSESAKFRLELGLEQLGSANQQAVAALAAAIFRVE